MAKQTNSTKTPEALISEIEQTQKLSAEEIYLKDLISRHQKHIISSKQGYIRDVTYQESMEIHRFLEKRLGRSIPLNHSCSQCVLDDYIRFIRITNC